MSYKILSLDGGGSWALIQARVLLDIYGDINGHELLKKFDMAIANSGGSLVLACLCNDMKLSEVISVFRTAAQRKQVFSRLSFWEKLRWRNIISLTNVLGPKYSMERKVKGLVNVLKEKDHLLKEGKITKYIVETQLRELPAIIGKPTLQLIIVGFDYFRERVTFFRSNSDSYTDKFSRKYYQVTLGHAIHTSSNAPVNYFDAPAEIDLNLVGSKDHHTKSWFWDGAVSGFNNPVLAGLVEAITNNYQSPPDKYCILSIGTGTGSKAILTDYRYSNNPDDQAVYEANKNNKDYAVTDTSAGFKQDVLKMSTSILGDPPDAASFIAYSFLDHALDNSANIVRINPCIKAEKDINGRYGPPQAYKNMPGGEKKFKDLMELGMDATEDDEVELISELCDHFIVNNDNPSISNQLIRGDINKDNKPVLGYGTYKAAKEKWLGCI